MSDLLIHLIMGASSILVATIEAICDEKVSRTKKIEHKFSALCRLLAIIGLNYYFFDDIYYILTHSVIDLSLYWFAMDMVWGYKRLGQWFYVGKTAELDKLSRDIFGTSVKAFIFFKLIVTVLSISMLQLISIIF